MFYTYPLHRAYQKFQERNKILVIKYLYRYKSYQ